MIIGKYQVFFIFPKKDKRGRLKWGDDIFQNDPEIKFKSTNIL